MTLVWAWRGGGAEAGKAARLVGLGFVSMLLSQGRAQERGQKDLLALSPLTHPEDFCSPFLTVAAGSI